MELKIDTDAWFILSIFFISTLALFVAAYIVLPYLARKKNINRIRNRNIRKSNLLKKVDHKYATIEIQALQEENEKLQVNLQSELIHGIHDNPKQFDPSYFNSNFEKLYPTFNHSLQKLVPDISSTELKLCALIRLNLSAKEISVFLNITPDSVNKARYRLRKKIGLKGKDDLFRFIVNI